MRKKILNTIGVYTPAAKDVLDKLGEVHYKTLTQEELARIIRDYEVVVVGLGLSFNRDVLNSASRLEVIATATTGLDHIDMKTAEEKGIAVLSLRGENEFLDTITGTAELAWGLAIDLMRYKWWAFDHVRAYGWDRDQFRGYNLHGKTLGVVGMGRLGKWVARYGKAFGMEVLYVDPHVTLAGGDYKKVSFDELLKKSDIISIHAHLADTTKNMFDAETLGKMKRTAYLINTSRGGIVDEMALLGALERGEIAGYGTDVLADETLFVGGIRTQHPLVEYSKKNRNVIIVPHIGGMTHESRERTDIFIAEKLRQGLMRGKSE